MKPGNLFESGANIGSKSKLDDERENDKKKICVYSLELFRGVHFLCGGMYRWQTASYFHQSQ